MVGAWPAMETARLGDWVPVSPWCSETLAMLATDNVADPAPLQALLTSCKDKTWDGSATELLAALWTRVDDEVRRSREWPKKTHVLSNTLRRLQPTLKEVKMVVTFYRDTTPEHNRRIKIVVS